GSGFIKRVVYPYVRSLAPEGAELPEEPAISIELARGSKPTHHVIGANRMDKHALCVGLAQFSVVDQFRHECDGSHLSHQRRIKADLIDPIHDLAGARRLVRSLYRVDVYNENVARLTRVHQREQCRIPHISSVPIVLAVDLDGLIEKRQTGRCEHTICGDVL